MTVAFNKAVRENVGLWINLIGGTGGGKTFTGMRLASGIAGDKPFAVIDTENRRALHYADQFKFDHAELRPPFRPEAYADAVVDADKAGYPVIMIDSGTHVWAGDGGVLDWQEEELEALWQRAKNNQNDKRSEWQVKEAGKMSAWIRPKMGHKAMVQKLLQTKAHIIFCLRAEEKIEMVKENGKTIIRPKQSLTGKEGWIPICDKNLPFEATCSFLLLASNPGIPHPIKLQEQHKAIFPLDAPIDEQAGKRLAAWASGTKATTVNATVQTSPSVASADSESGSAAESATVAPLSAEQAIANISKAVDADTLSMAADLAREACKTAPDKAKASVAYRARLGELKAMANEVEQ